MVETAVGMEPIHLLMEALSKVEDATGCRMGVGGATNGDRRKSGSCRRRRGEAEGRRGSEVWSRRGIDGDRKSDGSARNRP